jgi:hypothetical protein
MSAESATSVKSFNLHLESQQTGSLDHIMTVDGVDNLQHRETTVKRTAHEKVGSGDGSPLPTFGTPTTSYLRRLLIPTIIR